MVNPGIREFTSAAPAWELGQRQQQGLCHPEGRKLAQTERKKGLPVVVPLAWGTLDPHNGDPGGGWGVGANAVSRGDCILSCKVFCFRSAKTAGKFFLSTKKGEKSTPWVFGGFAWHLAWNRGPAPCGQLLLSKPRMFLFAVFVRTEWPRGGHAGLSTGSVFSLRRCLLAQQLSGVLSRTWQEEAQTARSIRQCRVCPQLRGRPPF